MKIPNPAIYFHKKIRVYSMDGTVIEGELYGYDYEIDDNDNEFLEFDVDSIDGIGYSFTEDEIERIEIVDG